MTNDRFKLFRSASVVWLFSLLSPFFGLLVEVVLAQVAGSSGAVDAYRATVIVLNIGSQVFFGTMTLQVIVPLFTELNLQDKGQESFRTAILFGLACTVGLLPVIFVVFWIPAPILAVLAPGLSRGALASGNVQLWAFALALLPMLWSGIFAGYLQARKIFWVTAVSQCLNNVCVLILLSSTQKVSLSLGLGNIIGFSAALLLHLAYLRRLPRTNVQGRDWREAFRYTRRIARLAIPPILAIVPPVLAGAVSTRELSFAPSGTLAECGFAGKPLLLIALLPSAANIVLLPRFSEASIVAPTSLERLTARALRLCLVLTVPIAAALAILRHPFIDALFGGRSLSGAALDNVTIYFAVLLIGTPAAALGGTLSQVSASLRDTTVASVASTVSAVVIIATVPFAEATSGPVAVIAVLAAAAWLSVLSMTIHLAMVHHLYAWKGAHKSVFKVLLIGIAAAGAAFLIEPALIKVLGHSRAASIITLGVAGSGAVLAAGLSGLALGLEESWDATAFIRRWLSRVGSNVAREN